MEEETSFQRMKHLTFFMSCLAQEIMIPYLMTFQTWTLVKEDFILEFGSS